MAVESLIRALASTSTMFLKPCLPQMKPFCGGSAHFVIEFDMAWLTAAAMALLSVFFRPSFLVFSADLYTLFIVSSSAVPYS